MESKKIRILYVDDEVNNLVAFKSNFRFDYDIITANSAQEGLDVLRQQKVHIIITDQRMPGMTGIEFLEQAIKDFPEPVRILLTAYSDIQIIIDAINKGQVYRYIMKPFNEVELKVAIENAYELYSLKAENKDLIEKLKGFQ